MPESMSSSLTNEKAEAQKEYLFWTLALYYVSDTDQRKEFTCRLVENTVGLLFLPIRSIRILYNSLPVIRYLEIWR